MPPPAPYSAEYELHDLLHMVASTELRIPKDADPSKPLDRSVYRPDLGDVSWLQKPDPDPPVIVFSKVSLSSVIWQPASYVLLATVHCFWW